MSEKVNISKLKPNPGNPRIIKDQKFKNLVQSIIDFPEMLEKRPIVVNKDMMVLGGNMRLKACIEAGMKEVNISIADWSEEKQREFIIKDNLPGGEWSWDVLNSDWDASKLQEWGLEIPDYSDSEIEASGYDKRGQFFINIRCKDETECQELYEKFIIQGLDVKIVT